MTEPAPLQQIERTYVRYRGRKLSFFSGCNYFRLASDPRIKAALREGLERYGSNVAASRLTSGNHVLYEKLEKELARFFGSPSALVVSTGYTTNLVIAQALAGQFSHVLLDEGSHPSLSDASRWFDCPVLRFKHRSVQDARRCIQRCGAGSRFIVLTDGMFARDGAVAPLAEYLAMLPRDGWILVDDAHGAGVLGKTGKGTLEYAGVSRGQIIQTVTLSKAFGAYGGAVLCTDKLRRTMLARSQMFIGSTPVPLPFANAALAGIRILKTGGGRLRERLNKNTGYVRNWLRTSGIEVSENPGPILSFVLKSGSGVRELSNRLLKAKIYPPFIRYPGGPEGGYFRFVISSEHSRKQLDDLVRVLIQHSDLLKEKGSEIS